MAPQWRLLVLGPRAIKLQTAPKSGRGRPPTRADEVLYDPKDFAIYGKHPPMHVLRPVCTFHYYQHASQEQIEAEHPGSGRRPR